MSLVFIVDKAGNGTLPCLPENSMHGRIKFSIVDDLRAPMVSLDRLMQVAYGWDWVPRFSPGIAHEPTPP